MSFKSLLDQVPNDVGGDGKRYAAALKRFLLLFSNDIDDRINGANGVKITSDGLHIENLSGAYVLFTRDGMSFYNKDEGKFAGIGRFMIGVAKDGQCVQFNNAWDITPRVIVVPTELQTCAAGYSNAVEVVCKAVDVSSEGFKVLAHTVLKAGAIGTQAIHEELVHVSVPENDGFIGSYDLSPPLGATKLTAKVAVFLGSTKYYELVDGTLNEAVGTTARANVYLYVNDVVADSVVCESTKGEPHLSTVSLSGNFSAGDVITLKVEALGESNYAEQQGSVQAVLESVSYEAQADCVIATGAAAFIVMDDISLCYTVL